MVLQTEEEEGETDEEEGQTEEWGRMDEEGQMDEGFFHVVIFLARMRFKKYFDISYPPNFLRLSKNPKDRFARRDGIFFYFFMFSLRGK